MSCIYKLDLIIPTITSYIFIGVICMQNKIILANTLLQPILLHAAPICAFEAKTHDNIEMAVLPKKAPKRWSLGGT